MQEIKCVCGKSCAHRKVLRGRAQRGPDAGEMARKREKSGNNGANGRQKLTCGSRLMSVGHGGAGGDGQSSDTYEPNSSQSLRNDDDFGGYS